MDLIETVGAVLEYGPICDHCLGRFFGKRSFGLSNKERGLALRTAHALAKNEPFTKEPEECWVCDRAFDLVDRWAARVVDALEGTEYATFLVGTRVPPLIAESEEMVWSDLSLTDPEPIKSELNREVGKAVSALTGKTVEFKRPDVVAILNLAEEQVEIEVNPVYFRGRYCKYERGIPQTHWDCRVCRGKGCERCNYTGKMYADSVEELIGRPATEVFEAETAVLHGSGREDIDARMLGTGRPFVMEMLNPKRREVDLATLEALINERADGRVAVKLTAWSSHAEVETLKSNKAHKKYRILVEIDEDISLDELRSVLDRLNGVTIHQRTPKRVAHRRADKIRERGVINIQSPGMQDGKFVIEVVGEAGLYIKELVSGDDGRTTPSLAGLLGKEARVTSLDVVLVEEPESGE
ncbi:tRNA pseudouridine(54/55) synthase Pus10 [Methanofollis aquaemaris]|uniref:tRNA pseudouridine synthase Pus10 n=1 Tax=Methanofollis aquaemaris TaxID=126734 RepID=A0A8A3S539_9EURY|nr:tRNA pseudouridine(54/55) synthase Pus10 [Methanofollis aquaemaris]QSZ66734.1 tRNA pseudouridine(54/55) synthase Pus10 [Methanofollis aquaemaris]